jgi:hypothetical protein
MWQCDFKNLDVVINTYLVFSINTMSVNDSCESCASSHCLHTVRTCDARHRRVVCAYSSCVILVCRVSRVVRVCGSHASSHVVSMHRVCHLLMSLALPRIVACILRVDDAGRTTSAHDNKLLLLTNTHVNNVNLSGHIF